MTRVLALGLLLLSQTPQVFAQSARIEGMFQFNILDLNKAKELDKTPSNEIEADVWEWKTSPLIDSQLGFSFDDWHLYLYPFQDDSAYFSFGYSVNDAIELGLDLGHNRQVIQTDDSTRDSRGTLLGMYLLHSWELPLFTWETNLIWDRYQSRESQQSDNETPSTVNGSFLKLNFTAVIPLAENASYLCGVSASKATEKSDSQELSITSTTLHLAGIRVTL